MRDFHDQKDLFKTIWSWWGKKIEESCHIKWVDAQIFVIDSFLWFIGLHGYKLQKDRTKNVDFYDIDKSINAYNDEVRANFAKMLKEDREKIKEIEE